METWEKLATRLRESTVQILGRHGAGSGVIWDGDGTIVSNAHVVRGEEARLVFAHGVRANGRVSKRDERRDLVILKAQPGLGTPAKVGKSAKLRPGELAIAVGNPLGVVGAVTAGMIHAVGPLWNGLRGNWIQADVRLAPGNSGGLLANSEGEVIGINTMVSNGLGLAIPSDDVARFVRAKDEQPIRLGVEMIPVRQGLVVVGIEQGSLAERARMTLGDVILCSPEDLQDTLTEVKKAGSVEIPVLHGGRPRKLRIHQTEAAAA